jgi:capsule polysaccharide modification protein KpsS
MMREINTLLSNKFIYNQQLLHTYLVHHHMRFGSQEAIISGALIQFKSLNQFIFSIKVKLKTYMTLNS